MIDCMQHFHIGKRAPRSEILQTRTALPGVIPGRAVVSLTQL